MTEKERLSQMYKARFLEASREARDAGHPNGVYTPKMLRALCDMAQNDIWPDWRFGDTDCNVWSMFHIK